SRFRRDDRLERFHSHTNARCPMKRLAVVIAVLALVPATAHAADPSHYRLSAKFDLEHAAMSVEADVTIEFKPDDETARFLLSPTFNITEARASDGASVVVDQAPKDRSSPATISVHIDRGAAATLHIAYNGPISASAETDILSPARIELSAD